MKTVEQRTLIVLAAFDIVLLAACVLSGIKADVMYITLFAAGYASLGLVSLRLSRGDALHCGAGLAVASLLTIGACATVAVTIVGGVLAAIVANRADEDEGIGLDLVRQPLIVAGVSVVLGYLDTLSLPVSDSIARLLVFSLVGLLYVMLDMLTYAALSALARKETMRTAVASYVRLVSGIYLGLASIGVVLALVINPANSAASLVAAFILLALMLIMKYNFGLFLQIRSAYGRTVAVLARLAEFGSEESRGHSERVADIATSVGRRLHLPHGDLERLNLAALLHSVGRVQASSDAVESDGHEVVAARIAERVQFLAPVADIVRMHHCGPAESEASREAFLAHLVGISCEFEQLVSAQSGADAEVAALVSLQARPGEFSERVVAALAKARGIPQP